MTSDKSSLRLAAFTLSLAAALLAWVELSLTAVAPPGDRHAARQVAPGLAIAVHTEDRNEQNVADVQSAERATR